MSKDDAHLGSFGDILSKLFGPDTRPKSTIHYKPPIMGPEPEPLYRNWPVTGNEYTDDYGQRLVNVHEYTDDYGQRLVNVHERIDRCDEGCTIHNHSEEAKKIGPQKWNVRDGIMERICQHNVAHPDPDELRFIGSMRSLERMHATAVHTCCDHRCCGIDKLIKNW